jgi:hypothetical protein
MNNRKWKSTGVADRETHSKVSKLAKIELIRKFQRVEGNFDCCASAYTRVCEQFECLWRDECLSMAQS